MRDLEIRGAGELLGAEQSGHVAAVGFELYLELLNEAVAELQGQRRIAVRPVRIDARIDAYVPQQYVVSEALRIDIHRRLALERDRGRAARAPGGARGPVRPAAGAGRAPLRDPGGEDQDRPARRRLPRLPGRQGDGRQARPRLRGAEGAPRPDPHGRLHRRSEGSEPAQRRRISAGASPGRCYLGGSPGSVKASDLSATRPVSSSDLLGFT